MAAHDRVPAYRCYETLDDYEAAQASEAVAYTGMSPNDVAALILANGVPDAPEFDDGPDDASGKDPTGS